MPDTADAFQLAQPVSFIQTLAYEGGGSSNETASSEFKNAAEGGSLTLTANSSKTAIDPESLTSRSRPPSSIGKAATQIGDKARGGFTWLRNNKIKAGVLTTTGFGLGAAATVLPALIAAPVEGMEGTLVHDYGRMFGLTKQMADSLPIVGQNLAALVNQSAQVIEQNTQTNSLLQIIADRLGNGTGQANSSAVLSARADLKSLTELD